MKPRESGSHLIFSDNLVAVCSVRPAGCDDGAGAWRVCEGHEAGNAFGLYDMHGNVWQWVEDCYAVRLDGAPADGAVWKEACKDETSSRVVRGGSWVDNDPCAAGRDRKMRRQGRFARSTLTGGTIRTTSAPRIATGSDPSSGTAFSASGWRVLSLLP